MMILGFGAGSYLIALAALVLFEESRRSNPSIIACIMAGLMIFIGIVCSLFGLADDEID